MERHELSFCGLGYGQVAGNLNTVMNFRVPQNAGKFWTISEPFKLSSNTATWPQLITVSRHECVRIVRTV